MGNKLYGNVRKSNMNYEWNTEPGACETCRKLNGKIFDSADDIPDKPHPNCKCWIKLIEKETKTTDPIEARRAIAQKRKSLELELNKIEGDLKCLDDECRSQQQLIDEQKMLLDKYSEQNNIIKDIINEYTRKGEQEIQKYKTQYELTDEIKKEIRNKEQNLLEYKEQLNLTGKIEKNIRDYRQALSQSYLGTIETKTEIANIQKNIQTARQQLKNLPSFEEIIKEIKKLDINIGNLKYKRSKSALAIFTLGINFVGTLLFMHDAAELWNIAEKKVPPNHEYIRKNGKYYASISELKDPQLEKKVTQKIQKQMQKNDSKGIVFNSNSSLAKKIQNSAKFKNFIRENKSTLIANKKLKDNSFGFHPIQTPNLFSALHNVDLIDIHLDDKGDLHLKVLDTYDFNKNDPNKLVKAARHYQDKELIETYYTITELHIPQKVWIHY